MSCLRSIGFVLCALIIGTTLSAQMPNSLDVRFYANSRLPVAWGDGVTDFFNRVVARHPDVAAARPFAVALTNASDIAVLGITVRWSWMDAKGMKRVHDQRSDSLFLSNVPAIIARQRVLVLPGIFVTELSPQFGVRGLPAAETLRQFEGASKLSVSIDCVVFSDGQVIGPDESKMFEVLLARRRMAGEIGRAMLSAIASGGDASAAAEEYFAATKHIGSMAEQMWRERLLRTIRSSKWSANALATKLVNLPGIPIAQRLGERR